MTFTHSNTMHDSLFLKTLSGELTKQIPFWFMRQAGRYLPEYREIRSNFSSFLEFCYTPDQATEVTIQPLRRYDMSAAILFSDILVIPDALGQKVAFQKGEGPVLKAIKEAEDIESLDQSNVLNHLSPVFEAVRGIREQLADDKALIGFAGAPWTVACYMIEGKGSKEFAETRQFAYSHRELFQKLIDILVESTSAYLIKQIESGANAIQLFDSWSGLIPEDEFSQWVIAPNRAIVERIRAVHPEVPIIGFARGAGAKLPAFVKETGVNAVGIDTAMSIEWVKDQLGGKVVVQGNLDPLLLASDKDKAVERTQYILETWRDVPFVFNLGHGIVPHTPPEHVQVVSEAIKAFKR